MVLPVSQLAGWIAVVHNMATVACPEAGLEAKGFMILLELDVSTACALTAAHALKVEQSELGWRAGRQLPAPAHDQIVKSVAGHSWLYLVYREEALCIWLASWREDAIVQRAKADTPELCTWMAHCNLDRCTLGVSIFV